MNIRTCEPTISFIWTERINLRIFYLHMVAGVIVKGNAVNLTLYCAFYSKSFTFYMFYLFYLLSCHWFYDLGWIEKCETKRKLCFDGHFSMKKNKKPKNSIDQITTSERYRNLELKSQTVAFFLPSKLFIIIFHILFLWKFIPWTDKKTVHFVWTTTTYDSDRHKLELCWTTLVP